MKEGRDFEMFFDDVQASKRDIYKKLKDEKGVYMFINKIDNSCYVGSSVDLRRRMAIHGLPPPRGRGAWGPTGPMHPSPGKAGYPQNCAHHYPARVRVCGEAAGDSLIYFHPHQTTTRSWSRGGGTREPAAEINRGEGHLRGWKEHYLRYME
uniref:GIY-YIG endonuclease n=1 Tax=Morchella brunnea TaxID=1174671 RepID=A0A8K1I7Y1_9PEZI|nr:GIY-YIG endonuclease [Morchella brunnea]UBU98563.1 GIY-YIG endonuclease [Morchella brunnea]